MSESYSQPIVSPVALPELGAGADKTEPRSLRAISGVPMTVSAVLGTASLTIAELESLEPGDVIRLDRSPDAVVDVLINGVHAAEGDVVVLDEMVAARISQLHLVEPNE